MRQRLEEDLGEMSKPLARYENDEDLERRQREFLHEEDPMAAYIAGKRRQKAEKAEKQNSGFVRPRYQGPEPPPNRFGIAPGYRWDGVDRSTGFEAKYFQRLSAQQAVAKDAYKWSVEDM